LSIFDRAKTDPRAAQRLAIGIVFIQTIFGAAAQVLLKIGTQEQTGEGLFAVIIGIFTNPKMFTGYALYGISALLMIAALKYGELSILYPVIAMTYVWVTVLSVLIFGEALNPLKIAGLASIVMGVAILGMSGRQPQ
jgi:multidrug transporter EmrE-like cation transporter